MENSTHSTIQKNVIRRVRIVHATRKVFGGELAALAAMMLALYGVGREVWVARVFQNMPSLENASAFSHFWLAAVLNTRSIVQVLMAVTIVAGFYFFRQMVRVLRAPAALSPA